jgi:methionyl-tRNA formyltransferase
MRVVFAGTPEFARQALSALIDAGHSIAAVYTQPDRPAGRGQRLQPSPVKQLALEHGLVVKQPVSLRDVTAQAELAALQAEVMVVAAYGLILPQAVLDLFPARCLNIHGSLLPRWRGAAPIQRAIEAGDPVTGITIMQMEAGLDTGPMLLREQLPIAPSETAGQLHDRLAALGAAMIVQALQQLDQLVPVVQPDEGVTYATKLDKAQARIDWTQSATEIERRLRAFDPVPGCFTTLPNGEMLKVWRAQVIEHSGSHRPGEVLRRDPSALEVACGRDVLRITALQRAGGKRLELVGSLPTWLSPIERFIA